ncbi:DUF7319 domain-containing protein [Halosegnis marinus]|uniref:DUF7319 domain-containing protein n=1 Tax=Halosegnis marinus TaxID=3034023 RepID=A0ABD5ZQL5_9EURY|nr:hypothetical protein [Halosegnis sp. DT85]
MADASSDPAEPEEGTVESAVRRVEPDESEELSTEELRRRVEDEYDFEDFTPADMKRMSPEEWEAVFDPDTWITGPELLDRVEADTKRRVLDRDVFARVERMANPDRVVAYSDEGYAVVYEDGSIEGEGTVLRDLKPSVALCSMDSYEAPDLPDEDLLPRPMEVPQGSGEFGNLMIQLVAGALFLSGAVLGGAALFTADLGVIAGTAGILFLVAGGVLFFTVANARLSDRFRAEEYRNRLRAVGMEDDELPEWLPESARETPGLDRGAAADAPDGENRD